MDCHLRIAPLVSGDRFSVVPALVPALAAGPDRDSTICKAVEFDRSLGYFRPGQLPSAILYSGVDRLARESTARADRLFCTDLYSAADRMGCW